MQQDSFLANLLFRSTCILSLLFILALALSGLDRESLWHDEAWSLWAVRGPLPETVWRAAGDVHPPLYFIILDLWVALAGEGIYAVRLLSALAGLVGLSLTCAIGRRLFDRWAGLMAALLLGSSGFFLYYTRETRMYSLLLCLAALSTWLYLGWLRRPTAGRLALYGLSSALLGYTHYYGLLIPLSQGLHLLLIRPGRLKGWLLAGGLALFLYLPWLPVLWQQVRQNPDGPLTMPIPTNLVTVGWLLAVLSGGAKAGSLVPFLAGRGLLRVRQHGSAILLLLLWLLATPVVVLTLNAWLGALYETRYVIGVLPSVSLLLAYGLRQVFWRPIAILLLGWLVATNLSAYADFWPPRPPRGGTMRQVVEARRPGQPSLLKIVEPHSLEAYYDRQLGLRDGSTIDLSAGEYGPPEVRRIVGSLATEPSVWVMMPWNVGETWLAMTTLAAGRGVGYRAEAEPMLFYRFDRAAEGQLRFDFGHKLRYDGPLFAGLPDRERGQPLCRSLRLTALTDLADDYSVGLHLVSPANRLAAQHDQGLGARDAGEQVWLRPCLAIPSAVEPGLYYLHLVVYTWADGRRLGLFEGQPESVYWGDALIVEVVQWNIDNR